MNTNHIVVIRKNTKYDNTVYRFIREHGDWQNWEMILIERYKCTDALEARKHERRFIETMHATLNSSIPTRTSQERYVENKDQVLNKSKEYYVEHRENKQQVHKEYYENHKDTIRDRNNTIIVCPCGSSFQKSHKWQHQKTKRHLAFIKTEFSETSSEPADDTVSSSSSDTDSPIIAVNKQDPSIRVEVRRL